MSIYRVAGGITFILIGLVAFGVALPEILIGIFAIIGGIALLAGI